MRRASLWFVIGLASLGMATGMPFPRPVRAGPGTTTRVSLTSAGGQANGGSFEPYLSATGRFVVFQSVATNLAPADTNGVQDVFVRDRQTGATTRVSVDSAGSQANGGSIYGVINADGRFVAIFSFASNLVPGDTNGVGDIFVHDRQTGATTRVSIDSAGGQANDGSEGPAVSGDGRYVVFGSRATNLVPGDTNAVEDVFVRDRQAGITTRVSVGSGGGQANSASEGPAISADGRYVAFESSASNLVPGDTNSVRDIFVHDRQTVATARASVGSGGGEANAISEEAAISGNGLVVVFVSSASNLVSGDTNGVRDIFVHDRQTGITTRVSVDSAGVQANNESLEPVVSGDGRFVAFVSPASNLVPGDTNGVADVFVHDRQTRTTVRVSVDSAGQQANGASEELAVSSDGSVIAFNSFASNLVKGDTNGASDVFVHARALGVQCAGSTSTILGTSGDDVLTGTAGPDVIHGLDGNDTINGLGGDDSICGGTGNDSLNGQAGNDTLQGDAGDDAMDGGLDRDTCDGGPHIVGDTAVSCEKVRNVP